MLNFQLQTKLKKYSHVGFYKVEIAKSTERGAPSFFVSCPFFLFFLSFLEADLSIVASFDHFESCTFFLHCLVEMSSFLITWVEQRKEVSALAIFEMSFEHARFL